MELQKIKIYSDFFKRTKDEPVVILQGSKRSGKTNAVLIEKTLEAINRKSGAYQFFSENPKQQNFGLVSDFKRLFNPVLPMFHENQSQKIFTYRDAVISFVNVPNNINAGDIVNSMGGADFRMMDEANNFDRDVFDKLRINSRGQVFLTYNPYHEFWANELITDNNFIKTTWRDNPFLSANQTALFNEWTEKGKSSEAGSYDFWRWQVMCEGNFAEMVGEIFTTANIHKCSELPPLRRYIIFADPSDAKGGDYFALTLTGLGDDGNVYLVDSFSSNMIGKADIAEKIKEWQRNYSVLNTYIETNGAYGTKFYNDCLLSKIPVRGWFSRGDKYERIMANFDVITDKLMVHDTNQNNEFLQQVYTFKLGCANDDNIDCLNSAIMAYITIYRELKVLF
jgi:predicted phage terminase large subunit-like protein